jgi:cytoskeletal protein CcmA (bactofilin family)
LKGNNQPKGVPMDKNSEKGFRTMIGEGAVLEGNISVPHGMRIDGTFRGKIDVAEMLTIGNNGLVEAEIKAKNVVIGGKVTGNIIADERIELDSHATHNGDLQTRELVINQGAIFNGRCSMSQMFQE